MRLVAGCLSIDPVKAIPWIEQRTGLTLAEARDRAATDFLVLDLEFVSPRGMILAHSPNPRRHQWRPFY
jgi:hypothetical protein